MGGYLSSKESCTSTWPLKRCQAVCERPAGWCTHAGARFDFKHDCDGDGVLDPQCDDDVNGHHGFISSKESCTSTWPFKRCPISCERPAGWCTHPGATFNFSNDC